MSNCAITTTRPAALSGRGAWIRLWPVLVVAAVVALLYAPVLARLAMQWYKDANYSHGPLVPLFSGYLIWQKRDSLAVSAREPSWWGLPVVLFSVGLLTLGELGAELFLSRVALILTIIGLVLYFAGWRWLRLLAFPLAFLFTMVPLPTIIYNQIVFPLQLLASRFATMFLQTTQVVPVLREGNLLHLPNYTLEVADACSGIRSLMSLLTLALGYGYIGEQRNSIRVVLTLAMVPLAVISNGLRVVLTAVLARYFGPVAAEGPIHIAYGWLVFLGATIMLLMFHLALRKLLRIASPVQA